MRGRIRSGLTRSRGWMMGCRSNNLLITRYLIKVTSVRSGLTRSRGWMMGCRSNNLLITRYPIKVTSVKKGGTINIGKQSKPVP